MKALASAQYMTAWRMPAQFEADKESLELGSQTASTRAQPSMHDQTVAI